jgi:integrase
MRLDDYEEKDGKKVWLSSGEMSRAIDAAEPGNRRQKITLLLAGRCGLRRAELLEVCPRDIVRTDHGDVVRVWEGKNDQYREVAAPDELIHQVRAVDRAPDEPLVDVGTTTAYKYVRRVGEKLAGELDDRGWQYLGPHDLRRSWAVLLLERGVLPAVVMEFGGWNDWQTFRDHYLAEFSPEALRRERGKVEWLGGPATIDTGSSSTSPRALSYTDYSV